MELESNKPSQMQRSNPASQMIKSVNLARGLFYIFIAGYLLLNKNFQISFGYEWCLAIGIPAAIYGCYRTYRSFLALKSNDDDTIN
jgi:hypothetical protein